MIDFTIWDQLLLRTYVKTDLPIDAKTPIAYLHYDWSLNEQ
ncbi:hypothetical protein ACE1CI_07030 [Aerosakkonemataceae cyanobacterium BLCC-F50]|uniref:Uncharacterized protein n=1 Tax=Floridaenema flaviceps BLCC-F50 TaxID=3153642 RepID=A0ABV4XLX2_9CYAN